MSSHSPQAAQFQPQSSSSSSSSAQPERDISETMDPATVGSLDEVAAASDGGRVAQVSQSSDISRIQSEPANQSTGRTGFFPIFDNPASMGAMLRAQSAQIREQTALLKCMDEKIDSLGVTERQRRDLVEFKRAVLSTGPFRINEVFQQVECNVCNQYKYSLLASERPGGIGRIGVFQISDDFDSVKRRNLLASLRDHLGTVTHERCAKLADSGKRQKDMEAEMCLARCVYFSLMEGLGGLGYERLLALCSLNGTDLGDQGHSRNSFKAVFTKAMASELKERISSLFKHQWACFAGRPSPFAVSCDKVTIRRRTLQPVGAFTMVNGMIKVYLLDAPIATAKSGDALTDLLISTIKEYFDIPFVQASMVGVATDGEYVNLRLGPRLHDSLDLDPSDLTHTWCLAHRLELACTDASKGVTNLRSELHPYMPSRHGKSFEELEKLSAEKGTRFYTPVGFVCTRWASSEHRVFKNFSANYPLLVMLDGAAQILRADWMVKFLIALDIMNLVAIASGGAQTVNFRPWQTAAAINTLRDKLIIIAEGLKLLSSDIDSVENMTQLNDSSLDICDLPSLKKARLNQAPGGGKWEGVQLSEVSIVRVRMAVDFMEAWVRQLMGGVRERILRTFPQWLIAASKLFSGQALFGDCEGLKDYDVALDDNNFPEVAEAVDDSSLLEPAGGFVISREDYNLDLETLVQPSWLLNMHF
ncbi:hypothetical protein Pmar_PMAR017777 [Perkinsus marinus ATCC 50983]|uniref:Uncharacterized protein n=1 Tax=Perkinsus marinus (strain ATCC 50983 / TXsc) TaxID=423536 RepID=C5L3Z0_PERM5|nr:hypothetical protein Pmar_PMAR017777 [Perkinsus marinus ATCC 50983]EER08719.1 hypothetical protein Pmar_PMAR017777 [Perkinsus marinus ATCC 50983]|eukprot:XP_002776903.1 hypothetical protein Pmar_PMAR017777 [Perkinsus marinus ATCC 50983]